ncbi:hypothetical protein [Aneurinibacillus danicus]|uniref:Uncharacterized protein n=1 Tax=Aneurinibacillus danicus TaxID=267746 RepID=A0A511VFB9_9BACL|nr:hypothetical protein [Aneurinibacillus danicus]GEN35932.1 hypothetical protein ADA01nite_33920 [Aneurinibacillus danicus]
MNVRIALRAKDATIPVQPKTLSSNPDFFIQWVEREVKAASPKQKKEWKRIAKQCLSTFESSMRRVSPYMLAAAPSVFPIPGLDQAASLLSIVASFLFKQMLPDIPAPPAKSPTIPSVADAAHSIPQAVPQTIPQVSTATQITAPATVQVTATPFFPSKHTMDSIIPHPVFGNSPTGTDLAQLFQEAIQYLITNGFWFLVAIFVSTFILKALGFEVLAKKMAKNSLRGFGILLLSIPTLTLIVYFISWIMSDVPGWLPPLK